MNEQKYLETELARYYPDARVAVTFDAENERIHARFEFDSGPTMNATFQVGSDDDWYNFVFDNTGHVITVPITTCFDVYEGH